MKIGVISYTHLREVNSHLIDIYTNYLSDVDMIIHAGDIISEEIVDFFSQKPLHIVHGNAGKLHQKVSQQNLKSHRNH